MMRHETREPFKVWWGPGELLLVFIGPILFFILVDLFFAPRGIWAPLISGLIQGLGILLFSWLFVGTGYGYSLWAQKFLPVKGRVLKIIKWSLLLWLGATFLNFVMQVLLAGFLGLSPEPQEMIVYIVEQVEGIHLLLYPLLVVILAPVAEEVFFRGLLYNYLRGLLPLRWAAIISSGLFALAHGEIWAFFPTFLGGLGFVYIFEKAKSLWAPVIAHIIWNGMGFVLLYAGRFLGLY